MKKLLSVLFLLSSLNAFASKPVYIYPSCSYNGYSGDCTLYNSSEDDVTCNINVRGQTQSGRPINSFEYRTIYQRSYSYIHVYASDPQRDPIRSLQATASCYTVN